MQSHIRTPFCSTDKKTDFRLVFKCVHCSWHAHRLRVVWNGFQILLSRAENADAELISFAKICTCQVLGKVLYSSPGNGFHRAFQHNLRMRLTWSSKGKTRQVTITEICTLQIRSATRILGSFHAMQVGEKALTCNVGRTHSLK